MALINCPECNKQVSEHAQTCPNCGFQIERYFYQKAREANASQDDIDYIEEDLRSPCTQEIAVFRAFADIVERSEDEVVVIDTAPTGHTLLLLESTESYDKEISRTQGETPESVKKLLPKLKNIQDVCARSGKSNITVVKLKSVLILR